MFDVFGFKHMKTSECEKLRLVDNAYSFYENIRVEL